MEFTIYVDRDIPIAAKNDSEAARIALALHEAVDAAIAAHAGSAERGYARTTCHRGIANKMVFDREREDEAWLSAG